MIKTFEECEVCEKDTEHQVSIEVRQDGDDYYSREPYRVSECGVCGEESVLKMNL